MMHSRSGALAVDMESGIAAEVCAAAGRPFAVLRAIADPVGRRIPEAALVGLTDDGRVDLWPVVSRLVRRPRDLPDLLRVGVDSRAALRALRLAVGRLGPSLGFQLA